MGERKVVLGMILVLRMVINSRLKWLRQQGCPWDSTTTSSASQADHLEVLTWARMNDCVEDRFRVLTSESAGRLDVMEWMWRQREILITSRQAGIK